MSDVVFWRVMVLGHWLVCNTTCSHSHLSIYAFWRCKYAPLHLQTKTKMPLLVVTNIKRLLDCFYMHILHIHIYNLPTVIKRQCATSFRLPSPTVSYNTAECNTMQHEGQGGMSYWVKWLKSCSDVCQHSTQRFMQLCEFTLQFDSLF